ncbi:hypothetical protein LOK49_LG02G04042 [Camellia lanceoleosa]|uniref:Uncharacterized protein n=1 Tax=Camellia lanceoleosa TaxID=1840588 RepID=A0ACC0INX4_9ERIC|nr:hypothetical protein LOK49_LG02G04042 [Camellia lanceoleosa]
MAVYQLLLSWANAELSSKGVAAKRQNSTSFESAETKNNKCITRQPGFCSILSLSQPPTCDFPWLLSDQIIHHYEYGQYFSYMNAYEPSSRRVEIRRCWSCMFKTLFIGCCYMASPRLGRVC